MYIFITRCVHVTAKFAYFMVATLVAVIGLGGLTWDYAQAADPLITIELDRITDTSKVKGDAKTTFLPGEAVRVVFKVTNTGAPVDIQIALEVRDPNNKRIYDSTPRGANPIGTLKSGETASYTLDVPLAPDTTLGDYDIIAVVRDRANFIIVYDDTEPGVKTTAVGDNAWLNAQFIVIPHFTTTTIIKGKVTLKDLGINAFIIERLGSRTIEFRVDKGEEFSGEIGIHAVSPSSSAIEISLNGTWIHRLGHGGTPEMQTVLIPTGILNAGKNALTLRESWGNNISIFHDTYIITGGPSSLPAITTVVPDRGGVSGGALIKITGNNFVANATVTIGGNSAKGVSVDSETQITAITPPGALGPADIIVTTPNGKSVSKKAAFTYLDDVYVKGTIAHSSGVYKVDMALTKGANIFSLPLRPETPITASKIAATLGATIVLRTFEGRFQAYLPDVNFGTDFTLEAGKGVIVNLLESKTYGATGRPWGTEVPAAPALPFIETWAFVIAGRINGVIPVGALSVRVTNLRIGESLVAPITSSGEFTAAFVDLSKQRVVAVGDVVITQLIGANGVRLTPERWHLISYEQIAHAYLLTSFSAIPNQNRLLQNYPNPSNPETWIPFQLGHPALVTVEIYDLKGRMIRLLELGYREAGWYFAKGEAAYWDGRNNAGEKVGSGVYFYHLRANNFSAQRKLVVTR